MIPAILVACSHFGLALASDTLTTAWQQDGAFTYTTAFILYEQWCNHARTECYDENGYGCMTDECTNVWTVYAQYPSYLSAMPNLPVGFWTTAPNGQVQTGSWGGPADWNMDGVMNTSDFFDFLSSFYAGQADQNLDGVTDSSDFFMFLDDFMG